MPHDLLITGFPGFLAGRLLRELRRAGCGRIFALVLPSMRELAQRQADEIAAEDGLPPIEPVIGDITLPGLGLGPESAARLQAAVTRVFHLAAVYDLAVGRELAEQVNVAGTRHLLDFCEELAALERLVYYSTCYVAGRREGRILESELEAGQAFRNHYESTKYAAEVEVRRRAERIPTVIVRPPVVVGDSADGLTTKYDGPYFLLSLFARWERRGLAWLSRWLADFGKGDAPLNVAPVDYIIGATVALADEPQAPGRTFQLADPQPLPMRDVVCRVRGLFDLPPARLRLPVWCGRAFARMPGVTWALGFPRQMFDYYDARQTFDTANAQQLLAPRGIVCPTLADYLPVLVDYVRRHPFAPGQPA